MNNEYFIKEGYVENPVVTFNNDNVEKYWTANRIELSKSFQYQVYAKAKKIYLAESFSSVVDIGCGPGTKARFFFEKICTRMTLIDQPSVKPVVRSIYPGATFHSENLENGISFSEQKFDLLICSDVIEHLQYPSNLLLSVKNLMHDKSLFVISTPDRDIVRGFQNNQSPNVQHVREWNKIELYNYISSMGFAIVRHINLPQRKLNGLEKIRYSMAKISKDMNDPVFFGNQFMVVRRK